MLAEKRRKKICTGKKEEIEEDQVLKAGGFQFSSRRGSSSSSPFRTHLRRLEKERLRIQIRCLEISEWS